MQKPVYTTSIKNLIHFIQKQNIKYIVYTYIFVDDENVKSLFFHLNSFDELSKAQEYKNEVIQKTSFPYIFITSSNYQPIQLQDIDKIESENVFLNKNNQIIENSENELYEKELKEFNKHKNLKEELEQEVKNEEDENNIEYFKNCIFQYSKYNGIIENQEKKLNEYFHIYNSKKDEIIRLLEKYPNYKFDFLPFLYLKLKYRNELELYNLIEKEFLKLIS